VEQKERKMLPALLAIIKHEAEQWGQASAKNLGCLLSRVIG